MNTTIFSLLFCILTAHCAIYKTKDEKLSRIVRSPYFKKSDSGDSSIIFRTQNWSGVAHDADGTQGVFSGAAATAGSTVPAADEAISIAASGAAPVKDRLEERFGGSDQSDLHYIHFNPPNFNNPYIPGHHGDRHWGHGGYGHDFQRGFSAYQKGDYNYGQLNSGANSQAFAKSESSSNAGSGCDEAPQNGLVGNGLSNIDALSKSQALSNAGGGFGDSIQNNAQFSSNSFSKSQATSYPLTSGQSNGGYGSRLYGNQGQLRQTLNGASNDIVQGTAESKTFAQSEALNGGVQQAKSFAHGFGKFQGLEHNGGQQVESHGNEFENSQSLRYDGGQQVESHGNAFSSSQGLQNGHGQGTESDGNGFLSSQGFQNNGGKQLKSYGNGVSSAQGFHLAGGHKSDNQGYSTGYESDQSQKASYGFDNNSNNNFRSQFSKGFDLGTGSTNDNTQSNYNKQYISSVSGPRNIGGDFTGHGQTYAYDKGFGSSKYQAGIQSEGLQVGGVSGQSSESDGNLINSSNSNGDASLSSNSGAFGHEDLQSTLSAALGLASQGLQASQNQPCNTCQKSSYAFSNAKSRSGSAVALSIGG